MKEKIIGFFEDVVKEMKKVTWPTKDELFRINESRHSCLYYYSCICLWN